MKIIVIEDKEKGEENNAINALYEVRTEELEHRLEERENFIKENHLKDITYDDILQKIDTIPNTDKKIKEEIKELIGKLLDNRLEMQNFDCELYYKAGIKDAVDIILSGATNK